MEPLDTMHSVKVRRQTRKAITYRWRAQGKMIVCYIIMGCVDVSWILHFTLHNHISHWLKDALLVSALQVITSRHVRVLRYDIYG